MTWVCGQCGHPHTDEQWNAVMPWAKRCHQCGSTAVTFVAGTPTPAEPPRAPPEPDPEPDPEPVKEPVKIPDDIQVDKHGTEIKPPPPSKRTVAEDERRKEIKAKPKPRKRK